MYFKYANSAVRPDIDGVFFAAPVQHCLSGWSHRCPQQPRAGLDLQSNMKSSAGTQTSEVEVRHAARTLSHASDLGACTHQIDAKYLWKAKRAVVTFQIAPAPEEAAEFSEVSRLPPFNFQHFSPKRRRPSTFQSST